MGKFEIEFVFEIDDLMDWVDDKEESSATVLDNYLMNTLRMLAYSTARGIIFTKTMGTGLMGLTLPVIDPSTIKVRTPQ